MRSRFSLGERSSADIRHLMKEMMKSVIEKIVFILIGALIALAGVFVGHFYQGKNALDDNNVPDNIEQYSDEEKFVIGELRESMYHPRSLRIVSITSENMFSYDGIGKWPKADRIYLSGKGDVKVYTIKYSGANTYGAFRLGTTMGTTIGAYWNDHLLGPTCYFFKDD